MQSTAERPRKRLFRREPSQARSRALVDAIVTAFDQMLRTFGNEDDVTVEKLVDRAGVSIGSFYEYFRNKDGLLGMVVERATRENFDALLRAFDASPSHDLESTIRFLADHVAATYLAHPVRTRMLLSGIGRLNWMRTITAERDRFAVEMAKRAEKLLPDFPREHLVDKMIELCDVAMGVVISHLYREPRSVDAVARQLTALGLAIVSAPPPKPEGVRKIVD